MPTVTTVTKPFTSKPSDEDKSAQSAPAANESAKVFDFGVHGLGTKAAS